MGANNFFKNLKLMTNIKLLNLKKHQVVNKWVKK